MVSFLFCAGILLHLSLSRCVLLVQKVFYMEGVLSMMYIVVILRPPLIALDLNELAQSNKLNYIKEKVNSRILH